MARLPSPLPDPGSKRRIAATLWGLWRPPADPAALTYVDPFLGGGVVPLAYPGEDRLSAVLNDPDPLVVNAWRAIRHAPAAVRARLVPADEFLPAIQDANLCTRLARGKLRDRLRRNSDCFDVRLAAHFLMGKALSRNGAFPRPDAVPVTSKPQGVYRIAVPAGGGGGSGDGRPDWDRYLTRLSRTALLWDVSCGSWTEALSRAEAIPGPVACLLNPPYARFSRGDGRTWDGDDRAELAARAARLGRRPNWRVAVCEYDSPALDRHLMPDGWRKARWPGPGPNGHRERVWLSPAVTG